jgi:hypothetical protein
MKSKKLKPKTLEDKLTTTLVTIENRILIKTSDI